MRIPIETQNMSKERLRAQINMYRTELNALDELLCKHEIDNSGFNRNTMANAGMLLIRLIDLSEGAKLIATAFFFLLEADKLKENDETE